MSITELSSSSCLYHHHHHAAGAGAVADMSYITVHLCFNFFPGFSKTANTITHILFRKKKSKIMTKTGFARHSKPRHMPPLQDAATS